MHHADWAHRTVVVAVMELGVIYLLNCANLCEIGSSLVIFWSTGQRLSYITYEVVAVDVSA